MTEPTKYRCGQWLWTDGLGNHSNPGAVLLLSRDPSTIDPSRMSWTAIVWSVFRNGELGGKHRITHWYENELHELQPYDGARIEDGRLWLTVPEVAP